MSLTFAPRRSPESWVRLSPPGEGDVHTDRVGLETRGLAQLGPQEARMVASRLIRFAGMLSPRTARPKRQHERTATASEIAADRTPRVHPVVPPPRAD